MNQKMKCLVAAILVIVTGVGVAACGPTGTAGTQGVAEVISRLGALNDKCDGPVNGYGGVDISVSGQDAALLDARMRVMRDLADQVAACGGYLKVVAFSSSAADTTVLAEHGYPSDSSGTDNARFIAADKVTGKLMGEAGDKLDDAIANASRQSTDVIAQLFLASQFQDQRSGSGKLKLVLATDGVTTSPPYSMNVREFDLDAAADMAARVELPKLDGATVQLAGIGVTAGSGDVQLPTTATIAITRFYELLGDRSGAEFTVTTDYTEGG